MSSRAKSKPILLAIGVVAVTLYSPSFGQNSRHYTPAELKTIKQAGVDAESILSKQRTNFDHGKDLSEADVAKMSATFNTFGNIKSASLSPDFRIKAKTIIDYRTALAKYNHLGGAQVGSFKSHEDLLERMALLKAAKTNLAILVSQQKPGTEEHAALMLELQIQEITSAQLAFLNAHWGKWKVRKDGVAQFDLDQSALNDFNRSVDKLAIIQTKQTALAKKVQTRSLSEVKRLNEQMKAGQVR